MEGMSGSPGVLRLLVFAVFEDDVVLPFLKMKADRTFLGGKNVRF